jgi:hypothetical protein
MAAIQDRSEGNERRRDRVAKLDKGPGVFVYDGSAVDHEWTPTPKLIGEGVAKLDGNGLPVIGKDGRQVFEDPNKIERDAKTGAVVMGGAPKKKDIPIAVYKLRGIEFPKGKPVEVDATLALKLRGMNGFEEVKPEAKKPKADKPAVV